MLQQPPGQRLVLGRFLRPPGPRSPAPSNLGDAPGLALRRVWVASALKPGKRLGSAEGRPGKKRGATSCLGPGRRPTEEGRRRLPGDTWPRPTSRGPGLPAASERAVGRRLPAAQAALSAAPTSAPAPGGPAACRQFWPRLGGAGSCFSISVCTRRSQCS